MQVSWKTFDADKTTEVRVVGVTVPDDIKVGQPYEVTAEVWSTEPQTRDAALQQDEFPNAARAEKTRRAARGQEPHQVQERRQARRLRRRTSCGSRSSSTTPRSRTTQAVMTAPVKGKPSVLYVEGGIAARARQRRLPRSARSSTRTSTSRCAARRGIPSNPKELEKYDLVLVSDVPAHLMGAGQMAALDTYVKQHGRRPHHGRRRGLVRLGRLRAHDDREDDAGAVRLREDQGAARHRARARDRPLGLDAGPEARGGEGVGARHRRGAVAQRLSSRSIAFDSEATVLVPAAARRQPDADLDTRSRGCSAGGGTNIYPGLKEAYEHPPGHQREGEARHPDDRRRGADRRASPSSSARCASRGSRCRASASQGADRNMLAMIAEAGDGRLYMVEDIGALPQIFMKETQEAQKSQLVEDLDPRPRREEGRGDRGHRRRERAAAARLRVDQAQADRARRS